MLNKYALLLEKHYKIIFVASLVVLLGAFGKLDTLGLSNDMRIYFSEDNPYRASLDLLEETFGKQDSFLIYIESKGGDIFTKPNLKAIDSLTEKLWETPYSRRVDSLTNYQRTQAEGDDLTIDYLAAKPESLSNAEIQEIRKFATQEPSLKSRLVSKDGRVTAINVTFSFPAADPNSIEDIPTLAAKRSREFVENAVKNTRNENPDLNILIGGVVSANLTMADAIESDLGTLLPISYLFLFLVIYLFTRSLIAVSITLVIITLSIVVALGLFAFTGRPLTPTIGFVPTAIMAIAVADCVHFITGYINSLSEGKEKKDAVIHSLKMNGNPIIITSVTTMLGLLGLNFSEAQPYRDMGNIISIGVGTALFLSLTMLPSLLIMLPKLTTRGHIAGTSMMDNLSEFVIKRPKTVTITTLIAVVIGGSGFFQNEISERWYQYFGESFEIRQSVEAIDKNLSGIHGFHYTLDTETENGVYDPEFWRDVDAFTQWLREQKGVAHVDSMADIMKSINQNMNGGLKEYYRLPEERELAAQYLLLYQFGLPQGLGIETYINTDRSAIRLTASVNKSNSNDMIALDEAAKKWLESNASTITPISGTGMDLMFSRIAQTNANSLLKGTILILALVSVILLVVLKSAKLGVISLVPNLTPAMLAYGLWGYFYGIIDLSSTVVICIALGIVVDDTVHFLSKYRYAKSELRKTTEDSIRYAFHAVGSALVITTIALVVGFLITVLSSFKPSANLGILLSLTLSLALVIDLLLLPSLLLLLDRKNQE